MLETDFLIRLLEQAPTVGALLFLVYRQDKRLSDLQMLLIELLRRTE